MALETQHYIVILAVLLTLREIYQFSTHDDSTNAHAKDEEMSDDPLEEPGSKLGSVGKASPTTDPEIKFLYCSS